MVPKYLLYWQKCTNTDEADKDEILALDKQLRELANSFTYCFTYSQIALLTALLVGSDTADEADKDEIIELDKQVLSLLSLLAQQHKF